MWISVDNETLLTTNSLIGKLEPTKMRNCHRSGWKKDANIHAPFFLLVLFRFTFDIALNAHIRLGCVVVIVDMRHDLFSFRAPFVEYSFNECSWAPLIKITSSGNGATLCHPAHTHTHTYRHRIMFSPFRRSLGGLLICTLVVTTPFLPIALSSLHPFWNFMVAVGFSLLLSFLITLLNILFHELNGFNCKWKRCLIWIFERDKMCDIGCRLISINGYSHAYIHAETEHILRHPYKHRHRREMHLIGQSVILFTEQREKNQPNAGLIALQLMCQIKS